MKRMVKNGDLLDVEPDGSGVTFGGNLKVGGTIIANGEIRGGQVSASKFYLGTEEMPLVKANPAGEATETLEKVKIGNVAYNVGGGGSGDREIDLILPYPKTDDTTTPKKIYIDDDVYNKIGTCYYEKIKIYFQDGDPLGIFEVFHYKDKETHFNSADYISTIYSNAGSYTDTTWYGSDDMKPWFASLYRGSDSSGKYIFITGFKIRSVPILSKSKFDALYKLADKPTQDGTYVLKATVSGGAVTYTWVAQ